MTAPTLTPLPPAPSRGRPGEFNAQSEAFVAALPPLVVEMNVALPFVEEQAAAALAAALAGNLSEFELTALAGYLVGVNSAGTALEAVEITEYPVHPVATWEAGTSPAEAPISPVKLAAAILALSPAILTKEATSAELTISTSGLVVFAHGLAVVPKNVSFRLICKTAEAGFSIGDVLPIEMNNSTAAARNNACWIDATNVSVRFSNTSSPFSTANKATGASETLTPANWRLVIRVEA